MRHPLGDTVTSPCKRRVEAVRWPISNSATGEGGPWRWFTSWTEWCPATKSGWSSSRADKASDGSTGVRRGSVTQRAGRCPSGCLPYHFFSGGPPLSFFPSRGPPDPLSGAGVSRSPLLRARHPRAPRSRGARGGEVRLIVTWAHVVSNRYLDID